MDTNPPQHHPWCQRHLCDASTHHGRNVEIRSTDGFATVTVQLRQATGAGAVPVVVVAGYGGQVMLSLGQARAMSYSVRNACRQAGAQ